MKIRQVVTELFHVDGQTDMTKLTVVFFRSFAKAPKNDHVWQQIILFNEKNILNAKFYEISVSRTLNRLNVDIPIFEPTVLCENGFYCRRFGALLFLHLQGSNSKIFGCREQVKFSINLDPFHK